MKTTGLRAAAMLAGIVLGTATLSAKNTPPELQQVGQAGARTGARHGSEEQVYRETFPEDGTHVAGVVHGVVIWTPGASPYVMEDSILVAADGILVVQPGVQVKVKRRTENTALIDAYVGLTVQGTLRAEGRPDAMIQFTCAAENPTPYREWRGIEIRADSSPSILRWVRVEHAIFGIDAYGPALVSHCVFWKCHSGIYLEQDFTGDVPAQRQRLQCLFGRPLQRNTCRGNHRG